MTAIFFVALVTLLRDVAGLLKLCTEEVCGGDLLLSPPARHDSSFTPPEPETDLATGAVFFSEGSESSDGEKG